jgi:hypothetical protein
MRLEYYAATIPTAESLLLEYPGFIDPAGHTLGIEGFTMPIHLHTLSRMLAKIAHGYAIAELGYSTFEELLRISFWAGCRTLLTSSEGLSSPILQAQNCMSCRIDGRDRRMVRII